MSLDKKGKGNPNWSPGKSGNPNGRPTGAKSLKSILKVAATLFEKKRHPVDELIRIADKAEQAASHVIITKAGSTSWKVGEIVPRDEFTALNAQIKDGDLAEAKIIPGGNTELAAKIWADLLKYCEPQKKPVESAPEKSTTPEESKEAAEATLKLLQELENGQSGENAGTESSNSPSLDGGTPKVSTEASSEDNLRNDKGI